jgi:hypothetical protein
MPRSMSRRSIFAASLAASVPLLRPARASVSAAPVILPDGRSYEAYIPAASKAGQFFHYTCEFDAAWAVLATYGYDVPLDVQIEMVGHDQSVEPTYVETTDGIYIYGGEIAEAYSGNYESNFLARATGRAMAPLFLNHGLTADPVSDRPAIEDALRRGSLVWAKVTVDFKDWFPATWVAPSGLTHPTVLGNDHAVVVMGYNAAGVVIRDVLGPTETNWERAYEYDVPWERFLQVLAAQDGDALAVGSLPLSDA